MPVHSDDGRGSERNDTCRTIPSSSSARRARRWAASRATSRRLRRASWARVAIKAAVERAGIEPADVEEVIIGNVLPAGQGQAPARQAALKAGLPLATSCTTVNKMCGSAMKAAMLAHDRIVAGSARHHGRRRHGKHDQRAVPAAQGARRLAHGPPAASWTTCSWTASRTPTTRGKLMGTFAEECADKYHVHARGAGRVRAARRSRARSRANNDGTFAWEIAPVTVAGRKGDVVVDQRRAAGEGDARRRFRR